MKKLIIALLTISVAVSIVIAAKDDSETYHFKENGTIEKEKHAGFVDVTMQKKNIDDKLRMYYGTCTWRKGTGAGGEAVQVPVKAFLINKEEKRLRLAATYYTQEDGKFYFVLPKEADYKMGPVTSKALNMPPKVKEFFKKWFRENREKEWEEPQWHKA